MIFFGIYHDKIYMAYVQTSPNSTCRKTSMSYREEKRAFLLFLVWKDTQFFADRVWRSLIISVSSLEKFFLTEDKCSKWSGKIYINENKYGTITFLKHFFNFLKTYFQVMNEDWDDEDCCYILRELGNYYFELRN